MSYLMSDGGCARETSSRGLLDVGSFAPGGSGICSDCRLLGLASSSEDEHESLIVEGRMRLCGAQKDDECSEILRSRGEARQWRSRGTPQPPHGPPERLLTATFKPPVELLPGSVDERSCGSSSSSSSVGAGQTGVGLE